MDAAETPARTLPTEPFAALGRSVTKLGYGAWALSGELGSIDREAGVRSVLAYLDAGGDFIDTARVYGESERLIGRALTRWSGDPPVIATKVETHGRQRRWGAPCPVDEVFPRGSVTQSAETSLRELGVDLIDLLQLHLYWPTWGTDGYWLEELLALREEGRVRAIGVSIPDYRHELALPAILERMVDSVQTVINLFDPLALDCVVPLAAERNIAVIARGALDEGGLTGTIGIDTKFEPEDARRVFFAPERRDEYIEHVDRLRRHVPRHAQSLAALALKFVASQPGVTTVIVSMPDEQLVRENVRALTEPPLAPEVLEELATRHRWVRNFFTPFYWD